MGRIAGTAFGYCHWNIFTGDFSSRFNHLLNRKTNSGLVHFLIHVVILKRE